MQYNFGKVTDTLRHLSPLKSAKKGSLKKGIFLIVNKLSCFFWEKISLWHLEFSFPFFNLAT